MKLLFAQALLTRIHKAFIFFILMWAATSVAAHTYFFGASELNLNEKTHHFEIIHQYTAHDIENAIAEEKQINFSPEHPQYDKFVQAYFEKHFVLGRNKHAINLTWIGFEILRGQLFAYQESQKENFLSNLVVKNTILVDTYPKQINTVNYQDSYLTPKLQGSLTFNFEQRVVTIKSSNDE